MSVEVKPGPEAATVWKNQKAIVLLRPCGHFWPIGADDKYCCTCRKN
jgi:hypothetical protein